MFDYEFESGFWKLAIEALKKRAESFCISNRSLKTRVVSTVVIT